MSESSSGCFDIFSGSIVDDNEGVVEVVLVVLVVLLCSGINVFVVVVMEGKSSSSSSGTNVVAERELMVSVSFSWTIKCEETI